MAETQLPLALNNECGAGLAYFSKASKNACQNIQKLSPSKLLNLALLMKSRPYLGQQLLSQDIACKVANFSIIREKNLFTNSLIFVMN